MLVFSISLCLYHCHTAHMILQLFFIIVMLFLWFSPCFYFCHDVKKYQCFIILHCFYHFDILISLPSRCFYPFHINVMIVTLFYQFHAVFLSFSLCLYSFYSYCAAFFIVILTHSLSYCFYYFHATFIIVKLT